MLRLYNEDQWDNEAHPNVKSLSLNIMLKVVAVIFYQIMTQLNEAESEEDRIVAITKLKNLQLNFVALVLKLTIPTEQPMLVGEVSANFCG
jgi:hypothetical protein